MLVRILHPEWRKVFVTDRFGAKLDFVFRHGSSQAEVTKQHIALSSEQDVRRFDVTVNYVGSMQKVQGAKHVVAEGNYVLLRERVSLQFVEYAVQVQIDALHYEEHVREIGVETVSHLFRWNQHVQ